jgi:hypothetical protein
MSNPNEGFVMVYKLMVKDDGLHWNWVKEAPYFKSRTEASNWMADNGYLDGRLVDTMVERKLIV